MTTTTDRFDGIMRQIDELGHGTPEYHEAMWFLLSVMARRQAIIADSIRRSRADSERRRARAAATRARREAENVSPTSDTQQPNVSPPNDTTTSPPDDTSTCG